MSLLVCPLQDICPKYSNHVESRDHFVRLTHPCNEFLSYECEMGAQSELFIRQELGETVACSIEKHQSA